MGGRRNKRAARCVRCRMHVVRCVCAAIPQVPSRARWVVVQHHTEGWKTTNTGRLAALGIAGAGLHTFSSRTSPLDPPVVADGPTWMLWPDDDAAPASALPSAGPLTLVIPDGTWTQARKLVRSESLRSLPRVALPPSAHARWSLREETRDGGMSTLDAVCWLLREVDGPDVAAPLEELARTMWARTMETRGLSPEEPGPPRPPT